MPHTEARPAFLLAGEVVFEEDWVAVAAWKECIVHGHATMLENIPLREA